MILRTLKYRFSASVASAMVMTFLVFPHGAFPPSFAQDKGQYPHGHPPEQKTGRQPKPVKSQEGGAVKSQEGGGVKSQESGGVKSQDSGGGSWVIPTIVTVGVAGGLLAALLHGRDGGAATLSDKGPQIERHLNMSGFAVRGFVQGGWPIGLDFEVADGGGVVLTVVAQGAKSVEYKFPFTSVGRRHEIVNLPADFGQKPKPGVLTIRAQGGTAGTAQPVYFRLYGLGAGYKAVGSISIDQVHFGPATVRKGSRAVFDFHAHGDFDQGVADFVRSATYGGEFITNFDKEQNVQTPIVEDRVVSENWDTRRAKLGEHIVVVRAWRLPTNGADWDVAWSTDIVDVER